LSDPNPQDLQAQCEDVRAFLVTLRGGAPFLSPTDSHLLVGWLESGVRTVDILAALERVSESRQKRASRLPLNLSAAKRHLGKRGNVAKVKSSSELTHALGPVLELLAENGAEGRLRKSLAALDRPSLRAVLGHVHGFFDYTWRALSDAERNDLVQRATEQLADLASLVDPQLFESLVDERARALHRGTWPFLSIATLESVVPE